MIYPIEIQNSEVNQQDLIDYWTKNSEDMLIVREIRKKYDINEELAIQRQREEKLYEFEEYYNYCEQCKAYVKEMRAIYSVNK